MEQFEEISLKRLAEMLLSKISIIIAVTLIFGVAAFVYSETMVVPEYASTATFYVSNERDVLTNKTLGSDITASQMLVDTYVVIIKSDTVLKQVCNILEEHGVTGYTPDALRSSITASAVDETEVFQVTVRDTDSHNSYLIANVIADLAPSIIRDFIEASTLKVVDYAVEGEKVYPNIQNTTLLGLLLGLFLSCGFVVLRELFDMRVKTEDELGKWFTLPVLGVIPDINNPRSRRSNYYYYRNGSEYNNYRREAAKNAGNATENELVSKTETSSK